MSSLIVIKSTPVYSNPEDESSELLGFQVNAVRSLKKGYMPTVVKYTYGELCYKVEVPENLRESQFMSKVWRSGDRNYIYVNQKIQNNQPEYIHEYINSLFKLDDYNPTTYPSTDITTKFKNITMSMENIFDKLSLNINKSMNNTVQLDDIEE